MAVTNHDRVGKAMELLKAGLGPFVEREIKAAIAKNALFAHQIRGYLDDLPAGEKKYARVGRFRLAQVNVGNMERRISHDAGARGT